MCLKCPYEPGRELSLKDETGKDFKIKIVSIFSPFTNSCAMQVTALDRPEFPSKMVVKMADPRWLETARDLCFFPPVAEGWTQQQENAYISAVLDGRVSAWAKPTWVDDSSEDPTDWGIVTDVGLREAGFFKKIKDFMKQESHAYKRLRALQGTTIPTLFTDVTMDMWNHDSDESAREWLQCPGILIEYIEGVSLREMLKGRRTSNLSIDDTANDNSNRAIADQAILNAQCSASILPDFGFLHHALAPRNCLVRDGDHSRYQNFVIIDLGRSLFIDEISFGKPESNTFDFELVELFDDVEVRFCKACLATILKTSADSLPTLSTFRLRYSSGRFQKLEDEHELLYGPIGRTRFAIFHAVIMADVWRHTESSRSDLQNLFDLSRRVDKLLQENKPNQSEDQEWECRTVQHVAKMIFACDPNAAWQAYCRSRETFGSDSIEDIVIFPKGNMVAPDQSTKSRDAISLQEKEDTVSAATESDSGGDDSSKVDLSVSTNPDLVHKGAAPDTIDMENFPRVEDARVDDARVEQHPTSN